MQLFKSSICIILYLYTVYSDVYCDETNTFDDVTPSTPELKNIHSFFYMSEKDSSSSAVQADKSDQFAMIQSCSKELDEQNTQGAIFYKRLIAILLSNLAMQKDDDRLIGALSIEASSSEFKYLQNFVNGQGSIREVDRILDKIIKQSDYTACHYMTEMSHYFNLLSEHLINYLLFMKERWDITIISLTVISSFIILRKHKWSRGLIIFLLFAVIFMTSFFMTWWRLIQEAEIKLMAAQTQFAEMPIGCQPHKMGLWDKMVASFFPTNDCEKYYESIMTNPKLQVTPAYALTYFLSTVVFQPLSYSGLAISEFVDNATSKLNIGFKFPIVIVLFLCFGLCIILLPLFLLGAIDSIKLPFNTKIRLKSKINSNERQERIERIYEDTSPKKRLKDSESIKTILFNQQDKDPAGGDAGIDVHHLSEKHIKCKCANKNADESMECEQREKGDNDC
ncbi:uncharacterized protein [Anoplolepis gracilipes]|uniref:uncharacterized protein n=1 Tax=Anoplolepis gracilipes TaxID=354296 RepID=UPI003BA16AA2